MLLTKYKPNGKLKITLYIANTHNGSLTIRLSIIIAKVINIELINLTLKLVT